MAWSRESGQKSALCRRPWSLGTGLSFTHLLIITVIIGSIPYFQGFFHVPFGASACSAHTPISKLTAAPTNLVHLGWAKNISKCTKIPALFLLPTFHTDTAALLSRNWNFLLFSPPHNPQFLVCDVLQPEITVPNLPQYLQLGKPFLILFSAGDISQVESKEMLKLAKGRSQQTFVVCWLNL